MTDYILPLSAPGATDPERVGPKAANLALLARAGLPTPGGFCLTADAYRHQLAAIGADEDARLSVDAELPQARRLAIAIRLKLYQEPISDIILKPLLDAWREQTSHHG